MNLRKWSTIGTVALVFFTCLNGCITAFEWKEMNPIQNILKNAMNENIDRIFFNEIDPRKPSAFFGISLKWKLSMPILSFTDYPSQLQFAYPIKLPFSLYYDFAEERLQQHSELENEIRRKREAREVRNERNNIYNSLELIMNYYKLPARACLLRTICEVAETPFEEDMLGESLNVLLRASTAGRTEFPDEDTSFNQYVDAEHHGRSKGYCHLKYADCPVSVFDLLPSNSHKIEEVS